MGQFAIVSLLSGEAKHYHEQLRLDLETQFKLRGSTQFPAPSHITLKYRFETDHITAVEEILADFSQKRLKTPWALKGFNYFKNADQFVIFIDVIAAEATRAAHASLLQALKKLDWMQWGPFDHANLHYHVTLAGIGLTEDNFAKVWNYLEQQPQPQFDLFFDNLTLLQIDAGVNPEHLIYKQYPFPL